MVHELIKTAGVMGEIVELVGVLIFAAIAFVVVAVRSKVYASGDLDLKKFKLD